MNARIDASPPGVFFFVRSFLARPAVHRNRGAPRGSSLTTWIANVPGCGVRAACGLFSACALRAAAWQMRAWCSTAAHEHAMLEVRVRVPAPAPVSSDSACTPRATSAHDVGATALRACSARCELMKTQRTWEGAAAFPMRHLAVNEAPKRLRAFKSLPGAPITGPCTRVQPCLASTAGGERYSDGPPHEDSAHDGRELEWQSIGLLIRGVRVQAPGGQPFSSHRGASAGQLPVF